MTSIYLIIEDNGYDGFHLPYNDEYYLSREEAQKDADRLNKSSASKRDYYDVHELTLKK